MRDASIQAIATAVAGLAVAGALLSAGQGVSAYGRYEVAASGETVVVVDRRTGLVQTFARSPQAPHVFMFVGSDSRTLARTRREGGAPPPDDDEK